MRELISRAKVFYLAARSRTNREREKKLARRRLLSRKGCAEVLREMTQVTQLENSFFPLSKLLARHAFSAASNDRVKKRRRREREEAIHKSRVIQADRDVYILKRQDFPPLFSFFSFHFWTLMGRAREIWAQKRTRVGHQSD